ncbi:DUF2384 domain-containing protein [Mesorhizobium sp. M5C.F.Ca.IN.020.14.1.1]|nr:DUF2384 domain-containing protein [Mesorhizobium sp. M5C.F.Ca.IN.020.14.1.1]
MINSSDFGHIDQDKFASLIAAEVERILLQHNKDIGSHTLISVGKIAGTVVSAMTSLSTTHQQALCAIQHGLTDAASKFVHTLAVQAAHHLEQSAAGGEDTFLADARGAHGLIVSTAPGRTDALDSMLIEDWAGEVAGQTYLEKNLRIPRSTLHLWQRRNEVVALRKGRCKHVFPLAQFVDGRPAPGIRDVLSSFSNSRLAWFWLSNPSPDLDGRIPIELLRRELVAEVISAACNLSSVRNQPE